MEHAHDQTKDEKRKIWRTLGRARRERDLKVLVDPRLPPHAMVVTSLLHRLYCERLAFLAIIFVMGATSIWQAVQNADLRDSLQHPDSYIVPSNITDIMRIRANTISDELVYAFSETIVQDLTNVNYDDAETRYRELARYMHPTLKARFTREMREHIDLWRLRKIDQIFSFEKAKAFSRKSEEIHGSTKTVYTVEVWGTMRKYVEGRATEPYRERVTLKFTTGQVTTDRPWVFELLDIKRQTQQQIDDERLRASSEERSPTL